MTEHRVRLSVAPPGGRLDLTLVDGVADLSRTRIQQLIREGLVRIDGIVIRKPSHRLEGGEWIEAIIPESKPSPLIPEKIPLDVVFENEDLILVNKPAGMVVHPSAGHEGRTLVNAVLAYAPNIEGVGGEIRPGVVHRLDKDTSGLIVVAKNDRAFHALQQQFIHHQIEKIYHALVHGSPPTPDGRIEAPIGRHPRHRKRMAVLSPGQGRESSTIYHTMKRYAAYTLLEVRPITGRTHQIRLHLNFIGCPVVGDQLYGKRAKRKTISRQFLHAYKLCLQLPGQTEITEFIAPLPPELNTFLQGLQ